MFAGEELETSGWADREHSHYRCPSPCHTARLTHTNFIKVRGSMCWISITGCLYNVQLGVHPDFVHSENLARSDWPVSLLLFTRN